MFLDFTVLKIKISLECSFKVFKCHSIADMNEISIIKHVNGHSYIFFILLNLQYFDLTCSGLRQIQMIVTDEDVADEDVALTRYQY